MRSLAPSVSRRLLLLVVVLAAGAVFLLLHDDRRPAATGGDTAAPPAPHAIQLVGHADAAPPPSLDELMRRLYAAGDADALASARTALRRRAQEDPTVLAVVLQKLRELSATDGRPRDWDLWRGCFYTLAALGPPGVDELANLLLEPLPPAGECRDQALAALASIGPEAAGAVPALLALTVAAPDHAFEAIRVLGEVGPGAAAAAPRLHAILRPPVDDRLAAVAAPSLLRIVGPTPEVLATFRDAIEDEATEARAPVIRALAEAGPAAAPLADLLVSLLDDIERRVVIAAARTLGVMGDASPDIVAALRDALEEGIAAAAPSLAALGEPGMAALETVAAHGDDVSDRLEAMAAMEQAGRSLAPLAADLVGIVGGKEEWAYRGQALGMLARLPPSAQDERVLAFLEGRLDDPRARALAIYALARHPDAAARQVLLAWAAKADDAGRCSVGASLRLGGRDVEAGTALLFEVARNGTDLPTVRNAIWILLTQDPKASLSPVLDALEPRVARNEPVLSRMVLRAITLSGGEGARVVPILLRAFPDRAVRFSVAGGLAQFPAQASQSVPALLQACLDFLADLCSGAGRLQVSGPPGTEADRSIRPYLPAVCVSALETLGPRWEGTSDALEKTIAAAPPDARPLFEALRSRIVR